VHSRTFTSRRTARHTCGPETLPPRTGATRSGKPYDNHYCYVCRLADGKLRELTEYMDTELAASALGAP